MKYRKRDWDEVEAFELEEPFGTGKKGDYIVICRGRVKIMTAKKFKEMYEVSYPMTYTTHTAWPRTDWVYTCDDTTSDTVTYRGNTYNLKG